MAERWPLGKLVEVEWIDSCHNQGWGSIENHKRESGPATCRTVGYLVESTSKRVVLAQSQSSYSGHAGDIMTIPRSCVRKTKIHRGL